jgi:glycosyltransferase involved in cell wall biosynthesis
MESPSSNLSKAEASSATPLVSVVIPAYNAAEYIAEALDSVFVQSFKNYEVIVVNDGSPDSEQLEQVLTPYRDRIVFIKQPNRGPSGARNTAIQAARGKYVAMLDSDDAWLPKFLEEQVSALEADETVDLVYADARSIGQTPLAGLTFLESTSSQSPVTFESLLKWESSLLTTSVVARTESLVNAGLFDERFLRSEDFDLWLRVIHRGGRIECNPSVLARHRVHDASLSSSYPEMVKSQMRVFKKIEEELTLTPELKRVVASQLTKCEAHLRLHEGKRLFLNGNFGQALELLTHANADLKSFKLRLAIIGLRVAPNQLCRLYRYRNRFLEQEVNSRTVGV